MTPDSKNGKNIDPSRQEQILNRMNLLSIQGSLILNADVPNPEEPVPESRARFARHFVNKGLTCFLRHPVNNSGKIQRRDEVAGPLISQKPSCPSCSSW